MKKVVLFTLSLMLVMVGTAKAGEFLDYGSAQLAIADVDFFDNGTSLILSGGKKMDHVMEGFSAEGEFSKSIQSPEIGPFEFDYFTLGGYGVYTHAINDQVSVKGRLGLVYINSDFDSSTEVAFGFSGLYQLNEQYQLIGEYTIIGDLTHLGVGVSMPLDF